MRNGKRSTEIKTNPQFPRGGRFVESKAKFFFRQGVVEIMKIYARQSPKFIKPGGGQDHTTTIIFTNV